ncbi:SGNH/GDSL hydrolase family protein [Larkinella soli]|uniref:SGNH/GDSL hydrolase family protein n=1 Tax=Larkinella soli TaxID=1770527 RepID=UPI000FFB831E|nr:SGNH/GDSL hydrolase family protein [Larkinella soli]
MIWYEEEVKGLELKIRELPATAHRTVFYGSSSIRLWETLAHDFPDRHTLNLGFGGSTLAACSWFYERLVLPARPRTIVFYAGDNDLGDGRHAEEVYLFFCALMARVQQTLPDVPLTFMSIKPSPARWNIIDRIRFANFLIRQKIEATPGFRFIDVHTPMLDSHGRPRRDLFDTDGLHLSPRGYALWKQVLASSPEIF